MNIHFHITDYLKKLLNKKLSKINMSKNIITLGKHLSYLFFRGNI